jgi:hypothetical protein
MPRVGKGGATDGNSSRALSLPSFGKGVCASGSDSGVSLGSFWGHCPARASATDVLSNPLEVDLFQTSSEEDDADAAANPAAAASADVANTDLPPMASEPASSAGPAVASSHPRGPNLGVLQLIWSDVPCPRCGGMAGQLKHDPYNGGRCAIWHMRVPQEGGLLPSNGSGYRRRLDTRVTREDVERWIIEHRSCCS